MWFHWPREHLPGSKGGAGFAFGFPLRNLQGWMRLQSPQFIPFCTAGLSWLFELFFSTFLGNEASTSLNEVLSGSEEEKPSHNRGKTLPQERQSHSCPRDGDSQPWGGRVPLPEVLGGAGKGTRCPCSHTAFPNGAPHCSGCCPFISAPFWRNQTNYWLLIAGKALLALLPFPTGSREQPGSPQVSQRKLQGPSRSLWRRKSSSCCSVHPFPPSRLIPCSPAGEFGEPKCFLVIPVQPSSWGSRWASPGKIVPLRSFPALWGCLHSWDTWNLFLPGTLGGDP